MSTELGLAVAWVKRLDLDQSGGGQITPANLPVKTSLRECLHCFEAVLKFPKSLAGCLRARLKSGSNLCKGAPVPAAYRNSSSSI